jgi:MinD-like ATPase involved in chromosome partitioning or flagellar assembly
MNNKNTGGQIITFYSYKGGTGRTMALANTACLLAEQQSNVKGKGVLMIDWDLEAPGLHRYFHKHLLGNKSTHNQRNSTDNTSQPELGLIDLFYEFDKQITEEIKTHVGKKSGKVRTEGNSPNSEKTARQIINKIGINRYASKTNINNLSLIKAGNLNQHNREEYGERINTFDWEGLYNKSPHLIRVFAEILSEQYAYVLIDSRTGVTDVSGICTTLLPEKLVIVFTPNIQSLEGGLDLIIRATEYRKESADLRPLMIYPLVSRVASEEPELRRTWRFGNTDKDIPGYQTMFQKVLANIYGRKEISLDNYFDEIQIQHLPRYAYGEEIAVLTDKIEDRFSLKRSYETFTHRLIKAGVPWEEKRKESLKRRCFVIMAFGVQTDFKTGRRLDLDETYKYLIKPVVESKGFMCLRADGLSNKETIDALIFQELLTADMVIADISTADFNTIYQLGLRHALRPRGTIIISEDRLDHPFHFNHIKIQSYTHLGEAISLLEKDRFSSILSDRIDHFLQTDEIDSPLYSSLQSLIPPQLKVFSSKK